MAIPSRKELSFSSRLVRSRPSSPLGPSCLPIFDNTMDKFVILESASLGKNKLGFFITFLEGKSGASTVAPWPRHLGLFEWR